MQSEAIAATKKTADLEDIIGPESSWGKTKVD
jgi:hypothetical protein